MSKLRSQLNFRSRVMRAAVFVGAIGAGVLMVGPALGLRSGDPPRPRIVFDQHREVLSIETTWGMRATLWESITTKHGLCRLLQLTEGSRIPVSFNERAGAAGSCSEVPVPPQRDPIAVAIDWIRIGVDRYGVVLSGRLAPGSGAASVKLATSEGMTTLPVSRGQFLAELPATSAAETLAPNVARGLVIAYNAHGGRVATLDLHAFLTRATPASRESRHRR